MLTLSFKDNVNVFVAADKGFHFMSTINSYLYIEREIHFKNLSYGKAIRVDSIFIKLSCADLRWDELVRIILKLSFGPINREDLQCLSYLERCAQSIFNIE